jgi:ectoine hydroxylase-related dioxygenase (phytanoyl-CoA dioxygenase family)
VHASGRAGPRGTAPGAPAWTTADGADQHPGGHVPSFIRHDLRWGELALTPPVLEVVEACFGEDFKVIYTTGTVNQAGYRGVQWHSDGHLSQWGVFADIMPRLVTLWMLSEWTADNGGTWVVPRSHLADTIPEESFTPEQVGAPHPEAVHVVGPPGAVFFFDSRVWHSTAPNYTRSPRTAMTVRYAPSWIATRSARAALSCVRARAISQQRHG